MQDTMELFKGKVEEKRGEDFFQEVDGGQGWFGVYIEKWYW